MRARRPLSLWVISELNREPDIGPVAERGHVLRHGRPGGEPARKASLEGPLPRAQPRQSRPLAVYTRLSTVTYRPRGGHDEEPAETVDALYSWACVLAHIPDPRRYLVHYYGAYSNLARGKAKASGQAAEAQPLAPGPGGEPSPPS